MQSAGAPCRASYSEGREEDCNLRPARAAETLSHNKTQRRLRVCLTGRAPLSSIPSTGEKDKNLLITPVKWWQGVCSSTGCLGCFTKPLPRPRVLSPSCSWGPGVLPRKAKQRSSHILYHSSSLGHVDSAQNAKNGYTYKSYHQLPNQYA